MTIILIIWLLVLGLALLARICIAIHRIITHWS